MERSPTKSDSAMGREIRQRRRAAGLTQKQVAAVVGITGAQLHRYETGATRIATSRLIAIASALGVRPDSLMASVSASDYSPRPVVPETGDEMIELIRIFSSISDPRHRTALVAVARMLSVSPPMMTGMEEHA